MIGPTGIWSHEHAAPENYPHSELLCFKLIFSIFTKGIPIIDFGCGDSFYLYHLDRAGYWQLTGIEGNAICRDVAWFRHQVSLKRSAQYLLQIHDLTVPYKARPAGQVLSLEVGEHIPQQYEQIFIDNLCNNCNSRMVISWAIPGQKGIGHVNCRTNAYVIEQIESRGFKFNAKLSLYLRADIEIGVSYFKNTLMVFDKV